MPRLVDSGETNTAPLAFSATSTTAVQQNPKRAKRRFSGIKLSAAELREVRVAYGPFLSLEKAAEIAGLSPNTLKKQLSLGR